MMSMNPVIGNLKYHTGFREKKKRQSFLNKMHLHKHFRFFINQINLQTYERRIFLLKILVF